MNTSRSEQLYKTACGFMPGGVNSPVRACKAVGTVPLFIDHAKGSRIWDEDGNEFIATSAGNGDSSQFFQAL